MTSLQGKGASSGVAVGRLLRLAQGTGAAHPSTGEPEEELRRLEAAREAAMRQLEAVSERARQTLGADGAEIFEVHRMMLADRDFLDAVEGAIRLGASAEAAATAAGERFAALFSEMDDGYLSARAADIVDVSRRLVDCLSGAEAPSLPGEGVILCAEDLSPSETVMLDTSRVLAFVTASGSVSSHTAILAKGLGIPAIVGIGRELLSLDDGTLAIVDGERGTLTVSPTEEAIAEARERQSENRLKREHLRALSELPSVTRDGKSVWLYANVGSAEGAVEALQNGAEGIGLFRSELLFLGRRSAPSEQEQLAVYERLLREMGDRRTVVRTLDVGADKQVDYLGLPHEENPALGLRGVRLTLTYPELLRTQLRALYRASVCGRLAILFPMLTSEWELLELRAVCDGVRKELDREGIGYARTVELGVMIETPAAALVSDRFAPLVDFFSVGTNDLIQYTLACDRGNDSVDRFCDPHHPAVLQLIRLAAENAHAKGKWIGICGELAADTALTETFLRMGIDELSVSPSLVLPLREAVRSLDLSEKA